MKAVILAGGRGTRISERSHLVPKPMIDIGDKPILWHIMKYYASYGIKDFIICLGYRGYVIKEYFANFMLHSSENVTFDFCENSVVYGNNNAEPWRVTLIETGLETQTGGRLKRLSSILKDEDAFCMTYGDGLSNVDLTALIKHHKAEGRLGTVTTVTPPGRFGAIKLKTIVSPILVKNQWVTVAVSMVVLFCLPRFWITFVMIKPFGSASRWRPLLKLDN